MELDITKTKNRNHTLQFITISEWGPPILLQQQHCSAYLLTLPVSRALGGGLWFSSSRTRERPPSRLHYGALTGSRFSLQSSVFSWPFTRSVHIQWSIGEKLAPSIGLLRMPYLDVLFIYQRSIWISFESCEHLSGVNNPFKKTNWDIFTTTHILIKHPCMVCLHPICGFIFKLGFFFSRCVYLVHSKKEPYWKSLIVVTW